MNTSTSKPLSFALRHIAVAASAAVMASAPIHVAHLRSALAVEIDAADFTVARAGATLAELSPTMAGPVVCSVDGEFIPRAYWRCAPRPGSVVVFQAVPLGGGGSNIMRTLLTIAVIVAAMWIPGAVGLVGWQAAAATAAIQVAGTLLINALVPLPKPSSGNAQAGSPTYSVGLQANSARPEQASPVGYGQLFTYPDFACQPYQKFVAGEQYYHALFCVGKGSYNILRVQIGDTDIRAFKDVEFAYIGPGQASTDVAGGAGLVDSSMVTAIEVGGQDMQDLNPLGPFSACKPGAQVSKIHLDMVCGKGLGHVNGAGDMESAEVRWVVRTRLVDDEDAPLAAWAMTASETLVRSTATAVQVSYSYALPAGRYQVSVQRASAYSDNSRDLNDLTWVGLRATLTRPGIVDPNATYVALRIRASKQLSGSSQRKVGVQWQRLLPVYNGSTWAVAHTRSPAWALYDIWANSEYGRGISATRIDLATLYALSQVWAARQDRFDFLFDSKMTVHEAAMLIARAGRAVPLVRRGRYTAVRDAAQSLPVAMFSPRNIQKDSFSLDYSMPREDAPDTIRLQYRDGRFWEDRYVVAQVHGAGLIAVYEQSAGRPAGVPAPEITVDLQMQGVIGAAQAKREAAFLAACSRFRRTTASWTADVEGLIPAHGSLLAVAHDVPAWGQHAQVQEYNAVSRTITASQPMAWTAGAVHHLRMQTKTGGVTDPLLVTKGASDAKIIFTIAPPFSPAFNDADVEDTKFMFGPAASVCEMVRLKSIRPASDGTIQMTGVVEDARVHAADNAWLPGEAVILDPLVAVYPAPDVGIGSVYVAGIAAGLSVVSFNGTGYKEMASVGFLYSGVLDLKKSTRAGIDAGAYTYSERVTSPWISPTPITHTLALGFEARAVHLSGALPTAGNALGVWTNCDAEPWWGQECISPATDAGITRLRLELRDASTLVVLVSREISLRAWRGAFAS